MRRSSESRRLEDNTDQEGQEEAPAASIARSVRPRSAETSSTVNKARIRGGGSFRSPKARVADGHQRDGSDPHVPGCGTFKMAEVFCRAMQPSTWALSSASLCAARQVGTWMVRSSCRRWSSATELTLKSGRQQKAVVHTTRVDENSNWSAQCQTLSRRTWKV